GLVQNQEELRVPERTALARTWALVQIDTPESRVLMRQALHSEFESVRRAALHGVSLHRDAEAQSRLLEILASDTPGNRRVAAEALGRIGDKSATKPLLDAAASADDRTLQHAVCYALLELGDASATRIGLRHPSDRVRAIAALALDQVSDGGLAAADVIPL